MNQRSKDVIAEVVKRVESLLDTIQAAPAPRVESINLATYPGPLQLFCRECKVERMTSVHFAEPAVRVEGSVMHIDAVGTRHCSVCKGTDVGMRTVNLAVTVPAGGVQ